MSVLDTRTVTATYGRVVEQQVFASTEYVASCPGCSRDARWLNKLVGTTTDGIFAPELTAVLWVECPCER